MKRQRIWLAISLFCSQQAQRTVLNAGIQPFLQDKLDQNLLTAYYLSFNSLSGENIRLSLLCNDDDKQVLAEETDRYFKEFFAVASLPQRSFFLPVQGMFLPFPVNTVQYGLYKIPEIDVTKSTIKQVISDCILAVSAEEEMDEDVILTLALYLQIGLLKVLAATSPGNMALVQQYRAAATPLIHEEESRPGSVIKKYGVNISTFEEIYDEIMDFENTPDLPVWMETWLAVCAVEINLAKFVNRQTQATISIYRTIFAQLNLSADAETFLGYFINRLSNISNRHRR